MSNQHSPLFQRHNRNPILSAADWPYQINTVFNPGAILLKDGTTLLLCRVEDRRGLSHLTAARSSNGVDGWVIDPQPTLPADPEHYPEELWGVEDPRITYVPELDQYMIAYTAFSRGGAGVALRAHGRLSSHALAGHLRVAEATVQREMEELTAAGVFIALALLGLWSAPAFIAVGLILHGFWDLAHRPRGIPTKIPSWYPAFCAAYDFVFAGAFLALAHRLGRSLYTLAREKKEGDRVAVAPGDTVEAAGFPAVENYLPVLEDAVFRKLPQPPVSLKPQEVTVAALQEGLHHSDYVFLGGRLVDRLVKASGQGPRQSCSPQSLICMSMFDWQNWPSTCSRV